MPELPAILTDEEKSQIRTHMGYPGIRAASSFIVGFPATIETAYLIEGAMNEVRQGDLPRLRQILCVLNELECLDVSDVSVHVASRVGETEINHGEHRLIDARYDLWLSKLENLLCVPRNPFDKRWGGGGGPESINRRVLTG